MNAMNSFPDNWIIKSLGETCKTIKGKKPNNTGPASDERTVPYINIKAFESGCPVEFAAPGNYPTTEHDDVLVVWDGARAGLSGRGIPGYIGSTIAKIYSELADNRYLFYFLQSQYRYINSRTKGVGIPHVDPAIFNNIQFPIAPPDQQKRIVAEIEKQFSRLDEAVANLKRVKANIKRYKAAVLKAAVEGRLVETEASIARREGRSFETGEQLLQRILETRRSQWKGKGKYKEPAAPDTADLPELPEGWVWVTMPQIGELSRGKSKHRPRDDKKLYGGPYPFIQTGDVRKSEGTITEYNQTYSEIGLNQSRLWSAGTLCITIAANIAETGILMFAACFPDSIVGFRIKNGAITTRYVEYFIRTAREQLERFAPATAQKNINLKVLEAVAVPLPPYSEQERIVTEIDRRLSVLHETEVQVDANLKRAERLLQSVLGYAFSGNLVGELNIELKQANGNV